MTTAPELDEILIQRGDWTWRVRPDLAERVPALERALLRVEKQEGARKIKVTGGRRTIWIAPLLETGLGEVFIKHYSAPRLAKQLKHLVRNSRTLQEWEMGLRLEERGLPVARHLAMAERRRRGMLQEDFLVQEVLAGYENFDHWWSERFETRPHPGRPARRREEIRRLAGLIRRMHDLGVLQRDFKPDSIMKGPDGGFRLVDLERALIKAGPLSDREKFDNLAKIDQTFGFIGSSLDRLRFLDAYFQGGPDPRPPGLEAVIAADAEVKFRKRARERRVWVSESNSTYDLFTRDGFRVCAHRTLPRDFIAEVIAGIGRGLPPEPIPYPGQAPLRLTPIWCDALTAMSHTPSLYYRRVPFIPARAALFPGPEPFGLLLTLDPGPPVMTWVEGLHSARRAGESRDFARRLGSEFRVLQRMGVGWRDFSSDTMLYEAHREGIGPCFYVNRLDRLMMDVEFGLSGMERALQEAAQRLELTGPERTALHEGHRASQKRWHRSPDRW